MVAFKTASVGILAALAIGSVGCSSTVTFSGEGAVTAAAPAKQAEAPIADAPVKHAKINNGRIEIDEKVQFGNNSDDILPVSDPLLQEVADVFKEHPEIKKVEVQGHASSEGNAARNKKLSELRAKAVMAKLILDGVPADKLTAKGYGSDKPIADNDTEDGREKNRRVEFVILDPAQPGS